MTTTAIGKAPKNLSREAPLERLVHRAAEAWRRAATRKQLRDLTAKQLNDAGISRSQFVTGPVIDVDRQTMERLMGMR